jgi:hypothetical protein
MPRILLRTATHILCQGRVIAADLKVVEGLIDGDEVEAGGLSEDLLADLLGGLLGELGL